MQRTIAREPSGGAGEISRLRLRTIQQLAGRNRSWRARPLTVIPLDTDLSGSECPTCVVRRAQLHQMVALELLQCRDLARVDELVAEAERSRSIGRSAG